MASTASPNSQMRVHDCGKSSAPQVESSVFDRDLSKISETEGEQTQQISSSDDQLTPLAYARLCGLCIDFTDQSPMTLLESLPKPENVFQELHDPTGVFHLDPSTHYSPPERLCIEHVAGAFLQSVMVPQPDPFLELLPTVRSSKSLKQELPLLETDNELDILHFGGQSTPSFENTMFSLEEVDKERGESLEWSTKDLGLLNVWDTQLSAEKLDLPRSVLKVVTEYLSEAMHPTDGLAEKEALFATNITYTKTRTFQTLTPPLLPLSPPLTPFEPSILAGGLELLSDHTDPTATEAQALDEQLAKKDCIVPLGASSDDSMLLDSTDGFAQLYSPLRSALASSSSISPWQQRSIDRTVEVPLTPSNQVPSFLAKKKFVTFPDILQEHILKPPAGTGDETSSQTSFDAFFDQVIEPIAHEATQAMEQEQLQEADSLQRVGVPVMDFSQPVLPWKAYSRKSNGKYPVGETELMAQQKLLLQVKEYGLKFFHHWPGSSKIDLNIPWSPFPKKLSEYALVENIDDDRYIAVILADMSLEDVVVSDMLTWKPEGLRVIDDLYESEEELEQADFEEEGVPKDMDGLVKRRRREVAEAEEDGQNQNRSEPFVEQYQTEILVQSRDSSNDQSVPDMMRPVRKRGQGRMERITANQNQTRSESEPPLKRYQTAKPIHSLGASNNQPARYHSIATNIEEVTLKPDSGLVFSGSSFSASNALLNFMHKMGEVPKKPDSESLVESNAAALPMVSLKLTVPIKPPLQLSTAGSTQHLQNRPFHAFPAPAIPSNAPAQSFIISTELLRSQRSLVRVIDQRYKEAKFFERDFFAIATAKEADILVSPATGIVITTLQKIRQRALPGEAKRVFGPKERLLELSVRYERIILLVSDGATSSAINGMMRQLDSRDCDAITELTGHVSSLDAYVQVIYVGGGEEELAQWVVSCMLQYGIKEKGLQLLQEETFWEQLLRRAGLNAFAAQLILADLKATDSDTAMQDTSSLDLIAGKQATRSEVGLRAFVRMAPEERIVRYEGLLGGCRVLKSINRVLEQRWLSASDGFRAAKEK